MRTGGEIAYVAIGANLGDREGVLAKTIEAFASEADLELRAASPVFETDPIGPAGQGAYLNAMIEIEVWLSPEELLTWLQTTELAMGRDRSEDAVRWGARTLDLDLIFFGDRCIERPELVVPHPRAHLRAFVMCPMVALAPDFVHPVLGLKAEAILRSLGEEERAGVRDFPRPDGWPGSAQGADYRRMLPGS